MSAPRKLQAQVWMVAPETQKLMQALLSDGGDARFVGGCVRDALVNRRVIDIDIATPLKPEEVIERLKRHKIAFAPTGLKHGTVTAVVDGVPFEITTLRVDVQTFGRHAEVKYTDDWKTDASRRDFTINAMYATAEGEIFDPFGGVEDLRLGRVRFVGNPEKRIQEDVLRILRFFRFYAHFGRDMPDAAGLKACAAAAKQITKLSGERIRHETLKLLESDRCAAVWALMLQAGVVTHFLPEATNVRTLENLLRLEAAHEGAPYALRRLAALLDTTPGGLAHIVKALRLSNDQAEQLRQMVELAGLSLKMDESAVRKLVYRLGGDMTRNLMLLTVARANAGDFPDALYQAAQSFRPPRFPLTGDDVMKLGYSAGPEVGHALSVMEDWWVGQDFMPDRAACLKKLETAFRS